MTSLVPILSAVWVAIKSGIEIFRTIRAYNGGRFVEDSIAHTHQHLAVLLGYFIYGISVPLMIMIGGFVFSLEWMPLNAFIDLIILYGIEHFVIEREKRPSVIRFRDLFMIKKDRAVTNLIK